MAKKKETKADEVVEDVTEDQKETKADEVVEEQVRLFELSKEGTQFFDHGFILRSGEQKALPENPSNRLLDRIESGFIKEVE